MAKSTLDGKRVLVVDDEPDVLATLKEEILEAAPKCKFEMAATYQEAAKKIGSQTYDVVVLDIMVLVALTYWNLLSNEILEWPCSLLMRSTLKLSTVPLK